MGAPREALRVQLVNPDELSQQFGTDHYAA